VGRFSGLTSYYTSDTTSSSAGKFTGTSSLAGRNDVDCQLLTDRSARLLINQTVTFNCNMSLYLILITVYSHLRQH